MTTNWVDLIKPKDFIQQMFEESTPAYVCHTIIIEDCPPQVSPSRMAQISLANPMTITLPEVYNDFEDVFTTENAGHLPVHENDDNAIDLINSKQPPYGPIYSLSKNELSIL